MSFDWRQWSGRFSSNFKTVGAAPAVLDDEAGAPSDAAWPVPPAAAGLLVALILAVHYALTGDFLTAVLLAAGFCAAIAVAALLNAHRAVLRRLETSHSLYDLVAGHAGDLITRHDTQGVITFASPAARELLGISPTLLMRRGFSAVLGADDAERCQDAIAQCLELGAPVSVEVEIASAGAGAKARWLEFRCEPPAGNEGVVAVTRDITARRWHAIAMRQAHEEAESASRAKSAFIATISHELRTPLNAIIGFSEMLNRELSAEGGDPRRAEYSRIIHESGEHLMSLVKDLLDVSKIEAGRLTICTEPFRVPDMIASSVDTLRPAMAGKSIALDISIADDLDEMNADRRACKQMLINLLSNACKFTPEGGRIALAAQIDGKNVVLSVRDSGIGIAADHVARLGEPFYQIDTRRVRQHEGAGLGLAIVRGLVELHHGRLEIESVPGEGSCFRLVLPLDAEMQAEEAEAIPADDTPAHQPAREHPVALVA